MHKERWETSIGVILAVAGSAIGLGNFLRFPVQAAQNGGGAFMIPYFLSFIFVGLPLIWVEFAIGRYGGERGVHNTVEMFYLLGKKKIWKYIGVLGLFIPFTVGLYYIYIESWTLAFSFFSFFGKYFGLLTRSEMSSFLKGFQGVSKNAYFSSILPAYLFFLTTLFINLFVLYKGVAKGIERLAKFGVPLLFVLGLILVVRVFTLGCPDPSHPERNIAKGLGFIWNPRFDMLLSPSIWLAALGQIFFTLSVGWGTIHNYASYLKEGEDVGLNGLATASLNEFFEVVLGGTIAIPAAVAFFGLVGTEMIAKSGAFDLGFCSMPIVFQNMPFGKLFGGIWFILLFLAGITSSVSMGQPIISFLEVDLGMDRKRSITILGLSFFLFSQPVIFFLGKGFLDELDFWVGSFALIVFAIVETILFAWIFGMGKGWLEIRRHSLINIPKIFAYVIKYITPAFLFFTLISWLIKDVPKKLFMEGVPESCVPYVIGARVMMLLLFLIFIVLKIWAEKRSEKKI